MNPTIFHDYDFISALRGAVQQSMGGAATACRIAGACAAGDTAEMHALIAVLDDEGIDAVLSGWHWLTGGITAMYGAALRDEGFTMTLCPSKLPREQHRAALAVSDWLYKDKNPRQCCLECDRELAAVMARAVTDLLAEVYGSELAAAGRLRGLAQVLHPGGDLPGDAEPEQQMT